jgi:hypothetical protein
MDSIIQQVITNGVSPDLIYFLLIMPLVVMVATLGRHVLGLKLLGIYVILSMTYILGFIVDNNTVLSVSMGTGILVFIYLFSYYIKKLTINLGLHYFSRISLVITMISILLVVCLIIVGMYPWIIGYVKLSTLNPFALIMAVFLGEHFSSNQTQKGIKTSRILFLNSLVLSLLVGALISIDDFGSFILKYPYLALVFMLFTFMAGKYKGMRVSELVRFGNISVEDSND